MNKKNLEKNTVGLRKKIAGMLELPREIVLNLPLITITGKEEINIENYKGVIEYTEERIRINTACGVLKIEGKKLHLRQITSELITVTGNMTVLQYLM